MPRMNVLSPSEQEQFDTPPVFTSGQQKHFFDFPLGIRELAEELCSPAGVEIDPLTKRPWDCSLKRFSPWCGHISNLNSSFGIV